MFPFFVLFRNFRMWHLSESFLNDMPIWQSLLATKKAIHFYMNSLSFVLFRKFRSHAPEQKRSFCDGVTSVVAPSD